MKKRILIDAGHGGTDRSNIGYSRKYIEADGNLKFAMYLRDELKHFFDVGMTREKDLTMSLTNRGKMAKGYDMFISVHSDVSDNITAGGVTVLGSVLLKNKVLGEKIGRALAEVQGIRYRYFLQKESIKYPGKDFYTVIGTAQNVGCPVVLLLERAFHSNPKEEQLLLDDAMVRKTAKVVADQIKEYYGVKDMNLEEALKILQTKGIIVSPVYWQQNAVPGKTCKGEYVETLIKNFVKVVK